jgi:DnaJ-class molecular chaperone
MRHGPDREGLCTGATPSPYAAKDAVERPRSNLNGLLTNMRDPYDVLGVSRTASEDDIKKAYRKLAKAHHPDRNASDPKAKDKFAEVNMAYEILGDAAKRAQFDRGEIDADGKPRFQGFEGFGGGRGGPRESDFEGFAFNFGAGSPFGARGSRGGDDIFSHLFGEAFRSAERGQRTRRRRGEDVSATLTVTLEDIASEAKKRVALPTGREVEVTLPKGVAHGQVIRLRGLGRDGAEPGDVHLTIRIAQHDRFTVEGDDVRLRLPINLEDAILGAKLRVPTLSGDVEMNIPAMTSSGRTFRLRGKGLPGKQGRGDLLLVIEVRLPEKADEALLDYARKRKAAQVA